MTDDDKNKTYTKFKQVVNMPAYEIDSFLKTEDSKRVGQKSDDGGESIGHESGRKIIAILKKNKSSLTDDDYHHMKKVISYIARHTAQGGPREDKMHSKWRYSLMNWGHDPCK